MRNVVQQTALTIHQGTQVAAHAVEIVAKIGQFITTFAHTLADTDVEIALSGSIECAAQLTNRFGDIPGQASGTKQAAEQTAQQHRQGRQTEAIGRRQVLRSMTVNVERRWPEIGWQTSLNTCFNTFAIQPENQASPQRTSQTNRKNFQNSRPMAYSRIN